MLLLSFPYPLSTKEVFVGLTNLPGHYVSIEERIVSGGDKRVASVLVDIDVSDGLPIEVKVVWGDEVLLQWLDYKGGSISLFSLQENGSSELSVSGD